MTYERRSAARLRKTLDALRSTDVDRVAQVIVSAGKGKFTKATGRVWLIDPPDGQEFLDSLRRKDPYDSD
jgi:hypothetical protein